MASRSRFIQTSIIVACISMVSFQLTFLQSWADGEDQQIIAQKHASSENATATVTEARDRARLLHETVHGSLQVMHRDFFRKDKGLAIPSQSLQDVFVELNRSFNVQLQWLAVDTEAMNVDHTPREKFEQDAVAQLKAGAKEFEAVDENNFRYVGPVRLSSACLSCHVPRRTDNTDRMAALMITIPLAQSEQVGPK
jgi:hypothetical protein